MCPFYLGAQLVLLPVSLSADKWFNAIKRYGGTMTAAPDFAYRFCTKFSKPGDQYDIKTLKRALIAAEPVRTSTVEAFEDKFGLKEVVKPGYGLAEASVAVTFWEQGMGDILVDAQGNVSAGTPVPGTEIIIVQNEQIQGTGFPGEILIKGPSCTQGYYANPEATQALTYVNGFIRTGDMGYLDEAGRLFIIGRKKQIIIRAGKTIAPRELEETTDKIAGVRLSAAAGLDEGKIEGESIHLFLEVKKSVLQNPEARTAIKQKANQEVRKALGYRPDKVHLVPPKSIPRTYNGKIQYGKLKAFFQNDQLTVL